MPEAEIARRGGARRVRTVRLPNDRYAHVYVVRRPGPRGGHTVMGESQRRKDAGSSRVKADGDPVYKIKPNTGKRSRGHK